MQRIPNDIHAFCHRHGHDDVTPRSITDSDISLLSRLAEEMRTQDTVGNRSPRYWGIMDIKRVYGVMDGYADGYVYVDESDGETLAEDKAGLKERLEEMQSDGELDAGASICIDAHGRLVIETDDRYVDLSSSDGFEELYGMTGVSIEAIGYVDEAVIVPGTLFLTQEEAWEHLKTNYYHYTDAAHPYAMCPFRSPMTERALEIIEAVDWTALAKGGATD